MNKKEFKKETLALLDIMIQNADKGPSGFWTDDYEGCGNPQIFPEFEEGLKRGRLVSKKHYLCPWNTAIMYGTNHGDLFTGCYYSCSIQDARYLPLQTLKAVLSRFRNRLQSGVYDNTDQLEPLLTKEEVCCIKKQQKKVQTELERKNIQQSAANKKKAAPLLQKYKSHPDIQQIILSHYGRNIVLLSSYGTIDFSSSGMKNVIGGESLSYNSYLDAQIHIPDIEIKKTVRTSFENCYYNIPLEFHGEIEKFSKNKVCFKKIFVSGMFPDGIIFDGKEDHVWMDRKDFESFSKGDCVSFSAEVYRYIKTGHGKMIDYSLCNPVGIKKIEPYKLPSDQDLFQQELEIIRCDVCYLNEHCNRVNCLIRR